MDKIRRERGGSSIEMSSESIPVGQAAHTTERSMSAMERMGAMYARNFANTLIRDAFVLLHQQMQLLPGRVSYQDGTDWHETEPRLWVQRQRLSVTLGESEGVKLRKAQALSMLIETQRQDAQNAFGVLVDYTGMYEARVDMGRNAGLTEPAQYWVDPESPQAQQAQQQQAEQAQQAQQMQMAQQQALIQSQQAMVAMQEETKRMSYQLKTVEAERDRVARMLEKAEELAAKYVEMELEYSTDVPERGIEGGEVISITPT